MSLLGQFSFPLAIGLNIEFELSYNNHTFVQDPLPNDPVQLGVGFTPVGQVPTPKRYYLVSSAISGFIFEDVTTVDVTIELAGGLCNRTLGFAALAFSSFHCVTYLRTELITAFQTHFTLPAHQWTVTVRSINSTNEQFNLEVLRYLQAVNNYTGQFDLTNFTSTALTTWMRFEYHPIPTLSIAFTNSTPTDCADGTSHFVMPSLLVTNATVTVTEVYPPSIGILACDYVPGTVYFQSFLGEDIPGDTLRICRDGCNTTIISDSITDPTTNITVHTNSRALKPLVIGYPEQLDPFIKYLYVRLPTKGQLDATLVCSPILYCAPFSYQMTERFCYCNRNEADQRFLFLSVPRVPAAVGFARPTWRSVL